MHTSFFDCECHSAEHTLRFDFDPADGELYVTVFLRASQPWYRRVWSAVGYVFGRDRRWGDFDCFIMQSQDRARLADVVEQFKQYHDKQS